MSGARKILVIGGGPAGVWAAIAAKKQDPLAQVVLLTDEHCEPYEKPPLSKAVLLGKALPEDALIAGPKGLAGHGVELEANAICVAIDRTTKTVTASNGKRYPYDALVLATGSRARELAILPPATPRVHYLRTEGQSRALKAELAQAKLLVVIGAGLIGLEVAASAAELGIKTIVLEVAPRILARVCDEETGKRIAEAHRRHGVDIRLDTTIASAAVQADGRIAIATDTGTLAADLVVVGAGALPDDRLAAAAGLACDNGIVVDEFCRSSDPSIFAAGDVVRFPGPHGLVRREDWRHAQDQGAVAGRNAAGGSESYSALPSFWSEQYDLYLQGAGWPPPPGGRIVRRPLAGDAMLTFHLAGDRLAFVLGINAQRDIAAARRLIERGVPVDPADLADPAKPIANLLKARA